MEGEEPKAKPKKKSDVDDEGNAAQKKAKEKLSCAVIAGFVICCIFLAISIVCLVLACVSFHPLYATWSEGPWKALAPCAVAASTTAVFVGLFGLLAFCVYTPPILIPFIILVLLSMLFSWSISIFALIGGKFWHKVDGMLGCDTKSTGVMHMYENVDTYLKFVDSLLCSNQCPCPMARIIQKEFKEDLFAAETFKLWNITEDEERYNGYSLHDFKKGIDDDDAFSFRTCSDWVKNEALDRYMEHSNATHHYINPKRFARYWKKIEKRFNCTGWCKTKYTDPYTNEPKSMYKFLFSDVNKGIPKYSGCLSRLLKFFQNYLFSFGGLFIFAALLQTIALIVAINLLNSLPPPQSDFNKVSKHE
ncbi:MAG: tetraspanin family protein [archaeon]|nr:tetraspanin family protein [archaeon]